MAETNYIKRLQNQVNSQAEAMKSANDFVSEFMAYLESDKFTGTDADGSRKDWISTGDVYNRMRELRTMLLPPD